MALDNKKLAKRAYAPYHRESVYCFVLDVLLSLFVVVGFLIFDTAYDIDSARLLSLAIKIVVVYIVAECFLNYRLTFLSIFENLTYNWIKQELVVTKIKKECSFAEYNKWASVISKLYPKEQCVDRYKLICKNNDGKKVTVRTVLSRKKYLIFIDQLDRSAPMKCTIHYGKHSKIILYYQSKEEWADRANYMF